MKRTPLRRGTPLRQQRKTPRRTHPDRVQHERIKPKAGCDPTPEEAAHIARVRKLPCLVCNRPATVHHVTGYADRPGRFARSHRLVVPLCNHAPHHQVIYERDVDDPQSVEGLNHQGFYRKYRINLLAEAERLWRETCELG